MHRRGTAAIVGLFGLFLGLFGTGFMAACDSTSMNGGNINTGTGGQAGHGGGPAGHGGGPAGGAGGSVDCADKFISLTDTLEYWRGTWVIDDAAKNSVCPNAIGLVFGHYQADPEHGTPVNPPDPEARDTCPPPAEFYRIQPTDLKDCDTSAYCPTSTGGYGFWVHAIAKASLTNPYELASEQLWLNSDGTWTQTSIQGQHVILQPSMTVSYFNNTFKQTNVQAGTCIAE
jgi:hypothetical protein